MTLNKTNVFKTALGILVASALIVAIVIIATLQSAKADGAPRWTGVYAGASLGYAATTNKADATVAGLGNLLTVDGFGSNGGSAGVIVGGDIQVDRFVIGAFADWTKHDQAWSASSDLLPGTLASLKIQESWTLGGRAGITIGSGLVYGLLGYTQMKASDIDVPAAAVSFAVPEFKGLTVGGGVELAIAGGLFAGLEYRHTEFDRQSINLIPGVADLGLQPTVDEVRARLTYKFGFEAPSSLK